MNSDIYEKLRAVPDVAKKSIEAGRLKGMTDVNPMWRIKRLTEVFGPCGIGWWYEITDKRIMPDALTNQVAAFLDINLFYKDPDSGEPSRPIPGTGGASFVAQERNGPYLSDECFKMALTDAISVAAKAIGLAADVYFEKDRDKYTAGIDAPEPKPAPAAKKAPVAPPGSPAYEATKAAPLEPQKEPAKFECLRCGKQIKPIKRKDGGTVGVRQWSSFTEKYYGQCLCYSCLNTSHPDWTQHADELA